MSPKKLNAICIHNNKKEKLDANFYTFLLNSKLIEYLFINVIPDNFNEIKRLLKRIDKCKINKLAFKYSNHHYFISIETNFDVFFFVLFLIGVIY